jgi:D-lactate dehydrogenase
MPHNRERKGATAMDIAVFDTHKYDRLALETANAAYRYRLVFLEPRLTAETAPLAAGFPAVCSFVNDRLDRRALATLHAGGTRLLALRSAGYNHVDLRAAAELGLTVVRVPAYSPHAVAEHAVALILALNRKTHRAFNRVRDSNFELDGLVGYDLFGKTVGVIGTGRIGSVFAGIMRGFGCRVIAFDVRPDPMLAGTAGLTYAGREQVFAEADILSLHVPLTPDTRHLVDGAALGAMKRGVVLINTSRGALLDTRALIAALKTGHVGAAGLDVYEEEEGIFFRDLSEQVLQDDVLARLLTFPNVLITAHQGFLTREALESIATTTLENVRVFESEGRAQNEVRAEQVLG